jgi:hypothetical protein
MPAPKIVTTHVYPPIPTRSFDWSAHYDGFEMGNYGYGRTEAEAIRDLTENCEAPNTGD